MVFRGEVSDPFVTVVMDFAVRRDCQPQRPPSGSSDHGTRNVFAPLTRSNQDCRGIFGHVLRVIFAVELDKETGPVLLDFA